MNLPVTILDKLFSIADNILSGGKYQLSYVTETKDWVIRQIGRKIIYCLNRLGLARARITTAHFGIREQIIHFGSVNTLLSLRGFKNPHKSNKIVLTWFHVVPDNPRIEFIKKVQGFVDIIHTASTITENKLRELGIPKEKIVIIPLGVDLNLFKPVSEKQKQQIKKKLGLPLNKIVIGSFQKDGVGWGEGLEPKLIKGPDIFVKAVEELSISYPIFVLLVGPARGYVKSNLEKRNIPYKSIGYIRNFREMGKYYKVLDLYLITSRIEGGPKQILETWASGIPVVSTKVGMVPDIARNGDNILLADVENINQLVDKTKNIIKNEELRKKIITSGLKTVQDYSWEKIAKRYFREIYSKLL